MIDLENGEFIDEGFCRVLAFILRGNFQSKSIEQMSKQLRMRRPTLIRILSRLNRQHIVVNTDEIISPIQVDFHTYIDASELRKILEAEAAALAAGKIPTEELDWLQGRIEAISTERSSMVSLWMLDDVIHGLITDYCGNVALAGEIHRLRALVRLYRPGPAFPSRAKVARLHAEHLDLLQTLRGGSGSRAFRAMAAHLEGTEHRKIGSAVRRIDFRINQS